jgi:hypothetical protein
MRGIEHHARGIGKHPEIFGALPQRVVPNRLERLIIGEDLAQ